MKKIFLSLLMLISIAVFSQKSDKIPSKKVFIMKIRDGIDPVMNRYVELAIEEAKTQKVDYIIIDMNTYGGGVLEADLIRTRILNCQIPTYVFINENAGSAGALISIACDSIYMSKSASFGASTVVNQEGKVVSEKYQSFMRSKMRSTAEANNRDPKIAEGMVGNNLSTDSAKVIAFTTKEAIENNYCEGERTSIEDILVKNKIENPELIYYELAKTDEIVSWFLNPFFKSILVMLIIGGLYFELQTPGVGFPLAAAVIGIILYFVPDYLHGLLANWELLIFFVGVILLAVEIFVIPGFGFIGITGLIFIFGSLMLSLLNNVDFDFTFVPDSAINSAFMILGVSIFGAAMLVVFGSAAFINSDSFKKLSLQDSIDEKSVKYTTETTSLIGKQGIAFTVLRPSGKIEIEGEIYDAFTKGNYIEQNENIIVVAEEGASYKVKKV